MTETQPEEIGSLTLLVSLCKHILLKSYEHVYNQKVNKPGLAM